MQAVDSATTRDAAEALGDQLCELAALTHAATADLIRTATAFDDAAGWQGDGIRSCAHWLSINAGLGLHTADELLRIGHALAALPAAST